MKYFVIASICLLAVATAMGQTWTSLNSPQGFKNVLSLTSDSGSASSATIYAADSVNLLKSTDGGATWSPTATQLSGAAAVLCKFDQPSIVLAVDNSSTYLKRSTNGGNDWNAQCSFASGTSYNNNNKPRVLAAQSSTFRQYMYFGRKYASSTEKAFVYSADSGITWQNSSLTTSTTVRDIGINPVYGYADRIVLAADTIGKRAYKGLYFNAANYGMSGTWTLRQSSPSVGMTAVASYYYYDFIHPTQDFVWSGGSNGKLYKAKWGTGTGSVPKEDTSFTGFLNRSVNGARDTIRSIRIDTTNPRRLWVATDRSLFCSADSGLSWSFAATHDMPDTRMLSLVINSKDSNTVVAGSVGYICRTTDMGKDWTAISSNTTRVLPEYSVAASGANCYGVAKDFSFMNSTTNSGTTWTGYHLDSLAEIFSGSHVNVITASGAKYVLASGRRDYNNTKTSALFRSTDGGTTWPLTNTSFFNSSATGTIVNGTLADPDSSSEVYAYGVFNNGSTGNWAISRDAGATWAFGSPSTIDGADIAVLSFAALGDKAHLYAGLDGAGLWRWSNNSWAQVSQSGTIGSSTIHTLACNPDSVTSVLYAGGLNGLYWSGNADVSDYSQVTFTQRVSSPYPKKIVIDPRFTAASDSSKYILWVGSNDSIYLSRDRGITNRSITGSGLPGNSVRDLRTDPSDPSVLYVATDGGIYKTSLPVPPQNPYPANGATDVFNCPLVLSWGAVAGASSYHLTLGTDSTFSTYLKDTTTSMSSYTYGQYPCGTKYYWRVNSTANNEFGTSKWSSTFRFTTGYPKAYQFLPNNASTVSWCSKTEFYWSYNTSGTYWLRADASLYNLDSLGKRNTIDTVVTNYDIYIPAGTFRCNTTYYWRVYEQNCSGGWDTSNRTYSFTTSSCTPTVTLSYPYNGQTNISTCPMPLLVWTYTGCADSFQIQVDTSSTFSSNPILNNIVQGATTSTALTGNLSSNTLYYWRVRGEGGGVWSDIWSSVFAFTTASGDTALPAPTLVSPADQANHVSMAFFWRPVADAARYYIEVSSDTSFGTIVDSTTVSDTSQTWSDLAYRWYYWHVKAWNCSYTSSFSPRWSFTTPSGGGPGKTSVQGDSLTLARKGGNINDDLNNKSHPAELVAEKPTEFSLSQNYPNPFNPTTRFEYALPQDVFVTLKIYDILGREVATLVDDFEQAGYKSVEFDASRLPSGMYFYVMRADRYHDVKKMLLVK